MRLARQSCNREVEAHMSRSVRTTKAVPVPECPSVRYEKLTRDEQTVRCVLRSCLTRQDLTRSLLLFCSLVNTLVLLPMGTIYHGTRKHYSVVKVLDVEYHTCQ